MSAVSGQRLASLTAKIIHVMRNDLNIYLIFKKLAKSRKMMI